MRQQHKVEQLSEIYESENESQQDSGSFLSYIPKNDKFYAEKPLSKMNNEYLFDNDNF